MAVLRVEIMMVIMAIILEVVAAATIGRVVVMTIERGIGL